MILHHLTMNSGHVAETRRSDVKDGVVRLLRPIVRAANTSTKLHGGGRVPGGLLLHLDVWPGLADVVGQAITAPACGAFQVGATAMSKAPYVMGVVCGVDDHEETAWQMASMLMTRMLPAEVRPPRPPRPSSTPWVAVTVGVPILTGRVSPRTIALLGDLERCLAWAILEEGGLAAI